ncbi:MAG: circularly permuted type 2 ATP-grasp protein, partial [Acidimicrobiia bacterium]|nr:circularly permuted type 2 ATP-grasp protein [Acidimicrobiia bacterium]
MTGLFDAYEQARGFDEAFDPTGAVRPLYEEIVDRFSHVDAAELRRLEAIVADEFRRLGITFTVYSENEGIERTWPMDLFPRL